MARHQDNVPPTPSQYEQRPTTRVADHEGKRRRMLKWLKKTIGMSDEHHHKHDNQREHAYAGQAPPPAASHYGYPHHAPHTLEYPPSSQYQPQYQPQYARSQQHDDAPRALPRSSFTRSIPTGTSSKDTPSLSIGSHGSQSSTFDQDRDLDHVSVYSSSTATSRAPPLTLSSLRTGTSGSGSMLSTTSTNNNQDAGPSSPSAPSIYEYHHQMRSQRKPRNDSSRVSNGRPHVLIIGGGIGGLCLAQGLKKAGIPFTVFERDPTPNYRTQGYRLRINSNGFEALKATLSREDFEVFLRSTGHFRPGFMYVNAHTGGAAPDGVKFAHRSNVAQHVFSTDRSMLRSLLLTDLHEGTEIMFDMAFKRYDTLPNGRVEVQFDNGMCFEGSVLVGADGTTSRVRRQYIPRHITLLDTDSAAIYGKTPITPEIEQYFATASTTMVTSQHPQMSVVIDPRCGSKFHINDYISSTGGLDNPANEELSDLHNYLCWVLIARTDLFQVDEDTTIQDLYAMSPEEVAELSIQMTSNWCPRVRALFETQDAEWCSFLRLSTMSPDIKAWAPSQVTLLGDACHTMIPAGIGCNTAMQDASQLVQAFCEYGVTVEAIARYEHAMREHGREGIEVSIDAGKRMFGLPEVDEMRKIVY